MTGVLMTPIVLSMVVLAAHFSRHDMPILTWLCLAFPLLLFVRRRWVARALQVVLICGALEWVRTTAALTTERMDAGEPWLRMAIILGAVMIVTGGSALLFETGRLRRRVAAER